MRGCLARGKRASSLKKSRDNLGVSAAPAGAGAVDDAVAVRARTGAVIEGRTVMVALQLGAQMHGGRLAGAAGELELAFVIVALKRCITQPSRPT